MTTVEVDAKALFELLNALNGPGHLLREIQALRGNSKLFGSNCIDVLMANYNVAADEWNKKLAAVGEMILDKSKEKDGPSRTDERQ